jgi:hypothetical protein
MVDSAEDIKTTGLDEVEPVNLMLETLASRELACPKNLELL